MDTFVLQAIAGELSESLVGARLDKVSQVDAHTITLFFSGRRGRCLLLSADPAHPRAHMVCSPPPGLPEAPTFCRTLRKHLGGLRLTRAAAGEWERVLQFSFEGGRAGASFALMAELMGRWSNLVLLGGATGEIIEVNRRVPEGVPRPLKRGSRYGLPPEQNKANPTELTRESLRRMLEEAKPGSAKEFARWLVRSVRGVSPALAAEIADVSCAEEGWEGAAEALLGVVRNYRDRAFTPGWAPGEEGKPAVLTAVEVGGAPRRAFGSMNEAADAFYGSLVQTARLEARKRAAARLLRRAQERISGAIAAVRRDLASAEEAEDVLRKGELLLGRLEEAEAGAEILCVEEADGTVEIVLDPRLSPSANAQKYFRRYKKLKRRLSAGMVRLREMEREAEFAAGLAFDLEAAEEVGDVADVEEALARAGYAGRRGERMPRTQGRKAARARPYRRFSSPAGWEVLVGKNAMGNEELCRRVGKASDTWFHARGIPGSHVLLRGAGGVVPDAETLAQAAAFAAYFSRGRADSKLPVDYVPFSSVRRPGGARPGQVSIGRCKTILVAPDAGARLCAEWEEIP